MRYRVPEFGWTCGEETKAKDCVKWIQPIVRGSGAKASPDAAGGAEMNCYIKKPPSSSETKKPAPKVVVKSDSGEVEFKSDAT